MRVATLRERLTIAAAAALVLAAGLAQAQPMASSGRSASERPPAFPASSASVPPNAADMQAVLDAQQRLGGKPIEKLTPAVARRQPSPADGVKGVMKRQGMSTAPDPAVSTKDGSYGSDPMQKARIYRPANAAGARLPVVVYYHGGGWVIADLKTYDATPRFLAKQLNALVVSVEYRHAPEHKFPAQHEDAARAYSWVLAKAASWGGDTSRLAFAGESAGGNLAIATAIYARDHRMPLPAHILSVYPIANSDTKLPSKLENGNTKPLNTAMMGWFGHYFSRTPADLQDPRINLVAADLHGLPPTTIVNAQNDPLRSDGETLAQAMRAAGDQVEQRTFPAVTHEFFGMGKVVRGASDAESYAVQRLQPALTGAMR